MSADVADVVLVRFTHIEYIDVVTAVEPLFQFFHFNFIGSHFGWGLLAANSAELLVIDQLSDCRIFPARWAIGILPQLELTEFHGQRVDQQ